MVNSDLFNDYFKMSLIQRASSSASFVWLDKVPRNDFSKFLKFPCVTEDLFLEVIGHATSNNIGIWSLLVPELFADHDKIERLVLAKVRSSTEDD